MLRLIEISILGLTNSSKLGEELGFKEDASLAVFFYSIEGIPEGTILGNI